MRSIVRRRIPRIPLFLLPSQFWLPNAGMLTPRNNVVVHAQTCRKRLPIATGRCKC